MRNFRTYGLCAVAATALLMAGCGGGSNTRPAAPAASSSSSQQEEETPAAPLTGTLAYTAIPQTTGLAALVAAGMNEVMVAAGGSTIHGGVRFGCAGETACTVTLTADSTNGDISGSWSGGAVTAMFHDPLVATDMNAANATSVAMILRQDMDANAVAAVSDNPVTPGSEAVPAKPPGAFVRGILTDPTATADDAARTGATTLGGMEVGKIHMSAPITGIGADDISMVSVTGALDPNRTTPGVDAVNPNDDVYRSSTVTAATSSTGTTDALSTTDAGAYGLAGWSHRTLFSDWGDTRSPDSDGGYETLAVAYSNIEGPKLVAFKDVAKALAMEMVSFVTGVDIVTGKTVATSTADPTDWFTLTEITHPDTTKTMEVVGLNGADDAGLVPKGAIVIEVEAALVADETQEKDNGERVRGTFFGAPGLFTCTEETDGCIIRRATVGDTDFTVPDLNGPAEGYGMVGSWNFKPDPTAMVMLPDQDWLAFGFWLTAPDDTPNGLHRLGVFYDGMDTYDYADATDLTGPGVNNLKGSATYAGAAAGYYVDGMASGVFTASSALTATFDANGNGTHDDAGDHMLTGRIHSFKNSMGEFLGSDTRADPNDPDSGRDSDWTVRLGAMSISRTDDATSGSVSDGVASGSADGVPWTGQWNARLYGPGDRDEKLADTVAPGIAPAVPPSAPSGVAGNFQAVSGELATGGYKGVIGAFGAPLVKHTLPASN